MEAQSGEVEAFSRTLEVAVALDGQGQRRCEIDQSLLLGRRLRVQQAPTARLDQEDLLLEERLEEALPHLRRQGAEASGLHRGDVPLEVAAPDAVSIQAQEDRIGLLARAEERRGTGHRYFQKVASVRSHAPQRIAPRRPRVQSKIPESAVRTADEVLAGRDARDLPDR